MQAGADSAAAAAGAKAILRGMPMVTLPLNEPRRLLDVMRQEGRY